MQRKVKNPPLISICIPTYNREMYLKECLDSITCQLTGKKMSSLVEIVISNNNSKDGTEKVIKKQKMKYAGVKYLKNKKNIGAVRNVIKTVAHASGKYIWFFSDDDWQKENAMRTVIQVIKRYNPDLILCNLDLYAKSGKKVIDANLLRTEKNAFFSGKKAFFTFLENKFFLPIDWYLTTYSNTILKKAIFETNISILKKYRGPEYIFPHKYPVLYSPRDYSIFVLAESLVKFRADNRSFGSSDQTVFLKDWYATLKTHDGHISRINKPYLSPRFSLLLAVKQIVRGMRLLILRHIGLDISGVLIRVFYQKKEVSPIFFF